MHAGWFFLPAIAPNPFGQIMAQFFYAGIGSRQTPLPVLALMSAVAARLAAAGWTLRSGGADGADLAFEQGAGNGPKEIYLPWQGFNGNASLLSEIDDAAFELAAQYHPNWNRLKPSVRRLIARNGYQVLGRDLTTPVRFVLCWTPDGIISAQGRTAASGGTGQAIAIAADRGIPVFNLARPEHEARIRAFVNL
jgi:hypothetical protein